MADGWIRGFSDKSDHTMSSSTMIISPETTVQVHCHRWKLLRRRGSQSVFLTHSKRRGGRRERERKKEKSWLEAAIVVLLALALPLGQQTARHWGGDEMRGKREGEEASHGWRERLHHVIMSLTVCVSGANNKCSSSVDPIIHDWCLRKERLTRKRILRK